jgi:hypothetical protein
MFKPSWPSPWSISAEAEAGAPQSDMIGEKVPKRIRETEEYRRIACELLSVTRPKE